LSWAGKQRSPMQWHRGHAEASGGAVAQGEVSDLSADQLSAAVADDDRRGLDGRKMGAVPANPWAMCGVSGSAAGRALSRSGAQGARGGESFFGRSPPPGPGAEWSECARRGVMARASEAGGHVSRSCGGGCGAAVADVEGRARGGSLCAIMGRDRQAYGLRQQNRTPAQRQWCCSIGASP